MYIIKLEGEFFHHEDKNVLMNMYKRRCSKVEYINKKLERLEDFFAEIDSKIGFEDNWMFKKASKWQLETNHELMETKFLSRMNKKDRNNYLYYKNNDYQDTPAYELCKSKPAKEA